MIFETTRSVVSNILHFFRLKPYKNAFLYGSCSIIEVIEQLYFNTCRFLIILLTLIMIKPSNLQKYSLFGGLTEDQIGSIIPIMEQEEFAPDEMIITEGKTNDKVYFIINGQVSVSKKDVLLARFSEGDAFGEMEVLDVMPAVASIKAVSPVTMMSISNKTLRAIYNMDVKAFSLIIMNLARDMSRRLRKTDEKIASTAPILL